jgi:hypothetical protein
VIEDVVKAYAFCPNAQCLGYQQEPVDGIRTTTAYTYLDKGGDMPGVESSTEMTRFADEAQAVCGQCSGPRLISEQERPLYPNISGHDPMGLFEFKGKTEGELREMRHQREIDELKRDVELKDLRAELAELKALLSEKANKPGPKPRPE